MVFDSNNTTQRFFISWEHNENTSSWQVQLDFDNIKAESIRFH